MDSGPGRTFTFPFQLSFTMKCRWITLELVSYLDALKNVAVLTVYYMCTQVNTHTHICTHKFWVSENRVLKLKDVHKGQFSICSLVFSQCTSRPFDLRVLALKWIYNQARNSEQKHEVSKQGGHKRVLLRFEAFVCMTTCRPRWKVQQAFWTEQSV